MRHRGFTLIELLVFIGLFSIAIIGLITIFVTITRVQGRETSANEVETQGQFLLQQLQYYIQTARLVDMPLDAKEGTLTLRESTSSLDPTTIGTALGANAITLVQTSTQPVEYSVTNIATTFPRNVSQNDIIAFGVIWPTTSVNLVSVTAPCVTGNLTIVLATTTSGFGKEAMGYGLTSASGTCAVTANFSGSTNPAMAIHELSGTNTQHPLDASAFIQASYSGGGTLVSTPSTTTTIDGDYLMGIAFDAASNGISWNPGSGFSIETYLSGSLVTEDMDQATSSLSTTISILLNSPGLPDVGMMAFEPATPQYEVLYLKQGLNGTPQALTSNKTTVSNVSFTRHFQTNGSQPYGTDSVSYSFTLAASTQNSTQVYSQSFEGSTVVLAPVPTIALVQQASNALGGSGITAVTSTYGSNNEIGDLLIAVVANTGSSAATVSLSDSAGNTWKKITSSTYSAYNEETNVFEDYNPVPASNTVTASFGTSVSSPSLLLYEYRGARRPTELMQTSTPAQDLVTETSYSMALPNGSIENDVIAFGVDWVTTSGVTLTNVISNCVTGNLTIASQNVGSGNEYEAIGYGVASQSGNCIVTANFSGPVNASMVLHEISGVNTASPLDGTAFEEAGGVTGGTPVSTPSVTTTVNGDYILGIAFDETGYNTDTWTTGSGFTERTYLAGALETEDMIQATAGTTVVTITPVQSFAVALGMMAFKHSPSAGDPFDAEGWQTQSSTTAPTSPFVNPTSTAELLLGAAYINPSAGTMTPGSGFTALTSSSISNVFIESQNVYLTGSVAAPWSYSASSPPTTSSSAGIITFH